MSGKEEKTELLSALKTFRLTIAIQYPHGRTARKRAIAKVSIKSGGADWNVSD